MLKKIKQLGVSSILVLIILSSIGILTMYREMRVEFDTVVLSENKKAALFDSTTSFLNNYEESVPRGKYLSSALFLATGICSSEQVVVGNNSWLFYSSKTDGNPIADYEGTNSYSSEELEAAKNQMLGIQNQLNKKGIGFCLIVPPNKENVYYGYMPKKYLHSEISRTDTLLDYLLRNGVNAVNPKKELLGISKDYKTFYKYDTHWNELGAYIGTKCVLDRFSIQTPEISEELIEIDTKANADLISIAGLQGTFAPDYGLTTKRSVHDLDAISSVDERELKHIYNEHAERKETVFVIGDSFREAMAPNLAYIFKNVYVIHRNKYKPDMLDEVSPNYVILEFVERYSSDIKSFKMY